MTDTNKNFNLERPDFDQFLFSESRLTAVALGVAVLIGMFLFNHFLPLPDKAAGAERLGFYFLYLVMLLIALRHFYVAIVGRSLFIDGKTKVITKDGGRLTGFAGVRSVKVDIGYYFSITPFGRSYTLSLQLKSGESVPVEGVNWGFLFFDDEDSIRNAGLADDLDEIADDIAALIEVPISKGAR